MPRSLPCHTYFGDRLIPTAARVSPLAPASSRLALSLRSLYVGSSAVGLGYIDIATDDAQIGGFVLRDLQGRTTRIFVGPFTDALNRVRGAPAIVFLRNREGHAAQQQPTTLYDSIWVLQNDSLIDVNPSVKAVRSHYTSISVGELCGTMFGSAPTESAVRARSLTETGIGTPPQRAYYRKLQRDSSTWLLWWLAYAEESRSNDFPTQTCSQNVKAHCLSPRALQSALGLHSSY